MASSSFGRLGRLLLTGVALFAVACGGPGDEREEYADLDAHQLQLGQEEQVAVGCESGAVRSCTIWLGRHGDLSNCVKGLSVCGAEGGWGECVPESEMLEDPELYASLAGDAE